MTAGSPHRQIIHLHAAAPSKPALGQACNGCGACCALEPCPLGMVLFFQRRGACPALHWDGDASRYQCGLLAAPTRHLSWLPAFAGPWFSRRIRHLIAAGLGCDFDAELE